MSQTYVRIMKTIDECDDNDYALQNNSITSLFLM